VGAGECRSLRWTCSPPRSERSRRRAGHRWAAAVAAHRREAATRAVHHADRAVSVAEVLRAMRAAGPSSTGLSWNLTVRRDLLIRERSTRGCPRGFTRIHRGRRVFGHPGLTKAQALRGYDLAHP
jgi:hypothetical protein